MRLGWIRFIGALLLLVILSNGTTAAAPAKTKLVEMFVFGDSYSDTGAGYVDCDGPTAVSYLADALGITLRPANKRTSPYQSLNYAVSGAQTGSSEGEKSGGALLGYGMQNQVDDFAASVKSGKIRFEPATTLFFFAGGLNDSRLPTGDTLEHLEGQIKQIYALGGRHFRVALMPTAIPAFSQVGSRLNPALLTIPNRLRGELRKADIETSKWGLFFDEVIRNPGKYGISNTKDACAGRAIFHEDETPCANPEAYFYYHAGHPSTAVHKIVGAMMASEMRG